MTGIGSGIGVAIASAVGKQIVSRLGKFTSEEIALQWTFRKDVLDMGEEMKDLEAVLLDADDKSRRGGQGGRVSQRWLTKFKRVAYDVEDVLDELDANELINKTQPKVKRWLSTDNPLQQRTVMSHKMKNVRKKIDEIKKEGQRDLSLVPLEARAQGSRNDETFGPIIGEGMESGMVGRETDKEKIIRLLLTSKANDADISIIPVVGLGGIGKTTLVQSVLSDKRLAVFDVSAWVNVSDQFSLHKIGSAILKTLNSNISLDNCTSQFLHDSLKNQLVTRRYLIVLDDLWEEDGDKLEQLKRMLQYGCKGSRIIVTTRNLSVVQKLRTGYLANEGKICPVPEFGQIVLDLLSTDDCWEIMKKRAFGPDDHQSILEEIGRQIAVKCGGLPLVANALGQVMSEVRTVRSWEDIRDTKVDLGQVHQQRTLESLMLSYYYMKLDFKMCFTYLAAFPKGFILDSNHLVQQWNALGYIYQGRDGQRCINYLLGMSFLQILPHSPSVSRSPAHAKAPPKLIMHDLVHDLASLIASEEFTVLDATKITTWNKARYCRHAQLRNYMNNPEVFENLPRKIRSLHFRDLGEQQLPGKAFSRSKYIRVLDISGRSCKGQAAPSNIVLPSCLHRLKLLRYLDATGLQITSLPKYFHALQNMETLILSKSSFETLPHNICSLGKLCYFDLSGNISLNKLPSSLGDLSGLSFLNLSGCSMLQELPESICELICLHHLDMSGCCALQKLPNKFGSLPKISFLNMSNCSKLTKLPDNVRFPYLEHLNLSSCHQLEKLPEDFSHLQKLEYVNISDCYKVSVLPKSFCQCNHLKYLDLSDCHNLEELPECFGSLVELEYLNLASCAKLRLLPETLCKLFKLRCLYLSYCLRLTELPSSFGDLKLEILHMNGLASLCDLPDSIGEMTSLTQFVMHGVIVDVVEKRQAVIERLNLLGRVEHRVHDNSGCSSIVDLVGLTCSELILGDLQNVSHLEDAERLKLRDKSDIRVLTLHWENEGSKSLMDRLVPPRTLEQFQLGGYTGKDFPNWMCDISSYLPFLSEVDLGDLEACDCLPPFGTLPNLRKLHLKNIPNIRIIGKEFYGEGEPCMKLRILELEWMENLEEWWITKSGEENEEFLIPNLHVLLVRNCPKLNFLPYPPRSMKWGLVNSDLVLPGSGFGNLSSSTLPYEMYLKSCSFSQDKWDRLQHLPTLESFMVASVSGLRTLPEVMRCFTSLKHLGLLSLEDLETLPVWLGQLTKIYIRDCPKLTCLPESTKNLTALRDLTLIECKGLEILPGWLGQLTSLEKIYIKNCPKLTCLPESTKNLTALRYLTLIECKGLIILPGWLGQLASLEEIYIGDCPKLTCLPESTKNLTALRDLTLIEWEGLEILPGWLGQLTSLQKIFIGRCPKLTCLPKSIRSLTSLKELRIAFCPGLLVWCLEEDAHNICHVPVKFWNVKNKIWLTLGEAQETDRAEFSLDAAESVLETFLRALLRIAEAFRRALLWIAEAFRRALLWIAEAFRTVD
ncbi:unnamed protein product [Alopecurus aequalis]